MKLKDIGEFGFIDRIKEGCLIRGENVISGIGDDCCVFKTSAGVVSLLTTDMLVEQIHFLLESIPPYQLGRKSLAVNLSDIAAMGGTPKEAAIAVAIPDRVDLEFLDALYDGMKAMAKEFALNLLGGDTTSSPGPLIINIALVGEALEEEILYRSGAQVGDVVFVTGSVGSAAAGLDIILKKRGSEAWGELIEAHHDPYPQIMTGRTIASMKVANALIDVSDGVAADLGHICAESKVGAIIEEKMIPTSAQFRAYCEEFREDSRHLSLHVGEDYVLLGTVPVASAAELQEALQSNGCQFHPIGKTVAEPGLRLEGRDGSVQVIEAKGWNHFR